MRRTLTALAALGLALGLAASPAHAAGGEPGKCLIEEAHVLADEEGFVLSEADESSDEDVEKATEAFEECEVIANPILPATNELIWGGLAFVVLFVVLAKFAYPPLKQAMADRTERIRDEVEQAERIRAEAAAQESAREDALKQARQQASELVEAARQEAEQYRAAERAKADEDIAALRAQAQTDAEASKQQALAELRGEVVTLAIGAAEEVVGQNLSDDANQALVESFIDRVGSDG